MTAFVPVAEVNVEALVIFGIVVAITLGITYWASKRTQSATDFWAAGRGITGVQNGFAIAGDYMSAASFLGIAGLIFLFGFDGFLYSVGFLVAFLTVLFLLSERMRNAGKFTIADVLSFRLNERPARVAAALGTLSVAAFYLIAQMVGAGALINALVGIDFNVAVIATGVFMLVYVVFGGMLATTWVQIVKAVLLMAGATVLSLFVLAEIGWNPIDIFDLAENQSDSPGEYLSPGLRFTEPIDTVSLGLALVLGTAGLPHILMRFFTVPDAKAARSSVGWAVAPDRRLLRHDDVPGLRRTRHPGRGGYDRPGRRCRQPRRPASGSGGRRRRRLDRGRRIPGDHLRDRVRDHPRCRRGTRDLGFRARSHTTSGRT